MVLNPRLEPGVGQRERVTRADRALLTNQPNEPERLLIVDDEESVAFTVGEVLRRDGYNVETVLSGEEALKKLRDHDYDLVLTDLHMEGIDGITVLEAMRRNTPLTIAIVLTGFASLESAISAMRHGAYDYLIKPCVIEDMKHTIRRALDHRRLVLAEQRMMRELREMNDRLEDRVRESTAELLRSNHELEEASKAKDIFFAMLSHELRTPLTAILGWAKILRRHAEDPGNTEQGLAAIERNSEMLRDLINQLLDVSRMISGKLQVALEPLDICEAVSAELLALEERAPALNISLVKRISEKPVVIQGSRLHLHQIISNLLANAIKYSGNGGIVEVEVEERGDEVLLRVRDNGIGIRPEFLPRIFDLFSQQEDAAKHRASGLGLGLAIVHKLTDLHKGWVRAESDGAGKGSLFTVGLPVSKAIVKTGGTVEELLTGDTRLSILLVEDSLDALDMYKAVFQWHGYDVLTAASGEEALQRLGDRKPGIIISDIGMPGMSGYDLLREIRRRPELKDIPAIAISGYATQEDRALALAAGFADHLAKPVDPDQLMKRVLDLLP
jgi:signal transduction histidine kinase